MQSNKLKRDIAELFGFKEELIESAEQCGLWHVRFVVNGIKYYGWVAYNGAVPQLSVEGYVTAYRWRETPVTEEYYNEFIKEKCIRLQYLYLDSGDGEYEWLNECFSTPEEADAYIAKLEKPNYYTYDVYEE